MDGKYLLRTDARPNEFGEYKIILQYCTQGIPIKKSTGISIHPQFWLGDNGDGKYILTGKNGHPKSSILNQRLVNLKNEIDSRIDSLLIGKNQVIPVPTLRNILNGTYDEEKEKANGKLPFVPFVLDLNREQYELEKIGYSVWDNIQCHMRKFEEFLKNEKKLDTCEKTTLYCKDIDPQIIKDYIKWRQQRNNSNDTINKSLTPLFKAIKNICRRGWIDRDICEDICNSYLPSNAKKLEDDTTTHYLTEDQIKELINVVKHSKYERTKEIFEMFMFSIYTCGLRFSDVATLRWEEVDLDNRVIKHLQVKGHTRKARILSIPISDESMKILENWKGRNENFIFGLLDEEFDLNDSKKLKGTLNSRDRTINTSLNALGEKIQLPFRLHFHISRHTFATIGLNKMVDIKTISSLMGHSSVLTTEKVYATLLPSTLEKTVAEKLNFHFQ